MIKKSLSVCLLCVFVFFLVSCGGWKEFGDNSSTASITNSDISSAISSETQSSDNVSSTTSTVRVWKEGTLTKDEFIKNVEGIWIIPDTMSFVWEGQYSCGWFSFSYDFINGGNYPGGYARCEILEYQQLSDNEFTIKDKQLPEDDTYPEDYEPKTTKYIINSMDSITVVLEDGTTLELIYGGTTFDEVNEKLKEIVG